MADFGTNTDNLEELSGSEFLLAIGERALRGRGPVRIVSTDRGFDLQIGPATLHTFDGLPGSAHPFSLESLAADLQFEGRTFYARAGAFNVLELPDSVWFGPELDLVERSPPHGRRILSTEKICLGLTREPRFLGQLEQVAWVRGEYPKQPSSESVWPPEVLPRSELPKKHKAVCVAPDLYGVLRDPEKGKLRFSFPREEYDAALQRWINAPVAVWDEEFPASLSAILRCLVGPSLFVSSLLLLPWLGPELQRRCRGKPIVQLLETHLCWLDSVDASGCEVLRAEIARLTSTPWGKPCGPPLCYENGSWVRADEAGEPLRP